MPRIPAASASVITKSRAVLSSPNKYVTIDLSACVQLGSPHVMKGGNNLDVSTEYRLRFERGRTSLRYLHDGNFRRNKGYDDIDDDLAGCGLPDGFQDVGVV
jgi:hypothetical protein